MFHAGGQVGGLSGGRTDGQTERQSDRSEEANSRFSQFCEFAKKWSVVFAYKLCLQDGNIT